MRIVAILQARTGSTRLPNKVLMPLAGKTMLQNIIERVQRSKLVQKVVVTCPLADEQVFYPIIDACRHRDENGGVTNYLYLDQWHDDPNDLVGRYLQAANIHNADLIVRIPCDNPCVDPLYIDLAIKQYLGWPQVYVSTMYFRLKDRVYLDGVGAEVVSFNRLQWLDQATTGDKFLREHPHKLFQDQHLIDGWEQYARCANYDETIRLDVNTQEDYEFIK